MYYLLRLIKYLREISIFVLFVILCFVVQCSKSKNQKINDLNALYKISKGETEVWKDKEGKSRARAIVAEIDARNINYAIDDKFKALKNEIGNRKKNLISYSRISLTTQDSFKAPVKDTIIVAHLEQIEAKVINYKDHYIEFKQLILPDSAITTYSIINEFEYYYYYKRPGKWPLNLFKRKEAVAEIKFNNPHTKGNRIYSLILKRN